MPFSAATVTCTVALAIQGVRANGAQQPTAPVDAAFPSAAAIDLVRNATDARLLAGRIAAASPDGSPGGTYALGPQIGAAVSGAAKMGSQPLTLALALAAAAVLSLVLTVLASVRRRRQELALLKTLGLRRRQVRAVVGWQTTTILIIAAAVGMPLGIAAGRWAWVSFANSIGVVPVAAVPVPALALALGFVVLLAAGNLLAAGAGHGRGQDRASGGVAGRVNPFTAGALALAGTCPARASLMSRYPPYHLWVPEVQNRTLVIGRARRGVICPQPADLEPRCQGHAGAGWATLLCRCPAPALLIK